MRKVVSYLVYALDGVVDEPQDWALDSVDDEMISHLKALIDRQDTVLLGRKTYQGWVGYWPTSTHEPFASFINTTPKYVASTTLTEVTWPNTTLLEGDVTSAVARLKEVPGRDIGVHGSVTLVRHLLRHDLLDELTLAVIPVAAGAGGRLFEDLDRPYPLHLVDLQRTGTGIVWLTYRPRPAPGRPVT